MSHTTADAPQGTAQDTAPDASAEALDPVDTLTLPAELTVFSVAETRGAALAWLARARDPGHDPARARVLTLDASAVVDVDGAGVQLLCALGRQAERDAQAWRVLAPSGALEHACLTLGLGDWLARRSAWS